MRPFSCIGILQRQLVRGKRMRMMKKFILTAAIVVLSTVAVASSLTDGLVGYWPFDGNVKDGSGRGHKLSGSVTYAADRNDKDNSAAVFNGTASLKLPKSLYVARRLTVSVWCKPSGNIPTGLRETVSETDGATMVGSQYVLYPSHGGYSSTGKAGVGLIVGQNGVIVMEHADGYCPIPLVWSGNIGNTWALVTITISGNGAPYLYINGDFVKKGMASSKTKFVGASDWSLPDAYEGNEQYRGWYWGAIIGNGVTVTYSQCPYYGLMDDFRIYNRALSALEIKSLYEEEVVQLHKVTFDANNGEGSMEEETVIAGSDLLLPTNKFHNDGFVFQGWALSSSGEVVYKDEAEITVNSDMTLYAVWKFQNAQVIVNFKKEDTELDLSCDNAYWRCDDHGGYTTFPIKSGEAFAMPAGTYTIKLYSGDTAFADPAPIQIVVDGTEGRIERDVVISRKKVWFSCVFYNQSNKENGMQPIIDEMNLNHFCWWRLDGGEWLREKIVQVPTGTHGLELRVEDHISLMVGMETFAKTIVLDGTETSHTEYINALGENGAKVSFRFNGHTVHEWEGSPVFDESRVLIRLRSMRGQMCLHAGEYILPQGSYTASFEYDAQGGNSAWSSPYDMSFNINGIDKSFVLNFIDNEEGHYRVNVWFDGNGGTVDTPLLSYAVGYVSENPLLNPTPNPRRAGYKFIGWYSSKKDGREISVFLPTRDDPGIEYVEVSGEDDNINGKLAIHLYARWKEIKMTSTWLSWFPSFFSASDGDVTTAASMTAANGCRTLDECYELGIDPEDPNDDLKIAEFKMKDGKPEITLNHTKDGSGNSFEDRVKILGKAELTDAEWQEVPPEGNPAHRFFKVGVEMP